MKIKVLLSLGLLALASTAANATTYTLQAISYSNAFATDYRIPGGFFGPGGGTLGGLCSSCGISTAVESGGSVTITGAAWNANAFGQIYSTSFDATTTVGTNVSLLKSSRVCAQIAGGFCTGNFSGFGGVDLQGINLAQDGVTACAFCSTDVTISGTELLIKRSAALSEANTSAQSYTLIYSTVPVPAAVWLFGSGLGLLGLARRKVQA